MSKAREEWMKANKEKVHEYKKKYRANNRQKCRESSKAWREANKEKESAYRKANKEKIYVRNANRRALKFRATIKLTELDKFVIDEMYDLAQRRTKETGFQWHVDHIIPLTKGGLHKPTNLQVVPASWNVAKGNRSEDKYNDYN